MADEIEAARQLIISLTGGKAERCHADLLDAAYHMVLLSDRLASELAQVKADLAREREVHKDAEAELGLRAEDAYEKRNAAEARAERAEAGYAEMSKAHDLAVRDWKEAHAFNKYWKARAEKSEALAKEQERVIEKAKAVRELAEVFAVHTHDGYCATQEEAALAVALIDFDKALTPEPAKEANPWAAHDAVCACGSAATCWKGKPAKEDGNNG